MKTSCYFLSIQKRLLVFLILLFLFRTLDCLATNTLEPSKRSCIIHALQKIIDNPSQPKKIESFDDLLEAFSHGLIPDLTQPTHRDAFEVYRRLKLGNPNTELNPDSFEELKKILQENPGLSKDVFRNYKLLIREKIYPVTSELESFSKTQITKAGQIRANLFKIDFNSGYWKKIFQYDENSKIIKKPKTDLSQLTVKNINKSLSREEIKKIKKKQSQDWIDFLNSKLPLELRKELLDSTQPTRVRAKILFQILSTEREQMASLPSAEQKDLRPISQAIIDLIHTIGFHDEILVQGLKSSDGMERLNSYRKILDERDRFAIELGFEDHFAQVIQKIGSPFGIQAPTGIASANGILETLQKLEQKVIEGIQIKKESATQTWKVRHLSLIESPFRSCLGGSDCSSRTYFSRALDPNYHYFTLTDESGVSSGQITIVLGEGKRQDMKGSETVKAGFIDKIQNVPHALLPQMIEGIRRSLNEKGYILIIPDDLGNHNGLSNEELTRIFVSKSIQTNLNQSIIDFKPHSHSYNFINKFSRADDGLTSKEVLPLNLTDETEILSDHLSVPWKLSTENEELDLHKIIMKSANLSRSTKLEDRLRYIPTMRSIISAGVEADPNFESNLWKWLSDAKEPFQLRKQALIYFWLEKGNSLSNLLISFDEQDKIQLLQNLLETPKYREKILYNKKEILNLAVETRRNKKIRQIFLNSYLDNRKDQLQALVDPILDARDLSDNNVKALIDEIKFNWNQMNLEGFLKIQKLIENTSLEKWLTSKTFEVFNSNLNTETTLGRVLLKCFSTPSSNDSFSLKLGNQLVTQLNLNPMQKSLVSQAFQDIIKTQTNDSNSHDFLKAVEIWMKDKNIKPELKMRFLLTSWGIPQRTQNLSYEVLQKMIPSDQLKEVMEKLDQISNVRVFQKLAEKSKNQAAIELGKLESFEFHPFSPSTQEEKQPLKTLVSYYINKEEFKDSYRVTLTQPFEIQTTPVTQLQWALVMGENPSSIQEGSFNLRIAEREIPMNPNQKVDQISSEDIDHFIEKLNELDPSYHYRLPTEAEWEYAVRTGKNTDSSIHNEEEDTLSVLGWEPSSSEQVPKEVATRPANTNGLYDTRGNIWELVQDYYSEFKAGDFFDPKGPSEGKYRVIRGGYQNKDLQEIASLPRGSASTNMRFSTLGFRLVRTLKSRTE